MAKCNGCGAEIIWIKTTAGKWMPCNAAPVAYKRRERGSKVVVLKSGETVTAATGYSLASADGLGYEPHWATCRCAQKFRKELQHE